MSDTRPNKCKIPGCRSTERNSQLFTTRQNKAICIHHFDHAALIRTDDTFILKDNAVPTLLLNLDDDLRVNVRPKRGASGLANLERARLKKTLRKERMRIQRERRNSTKHQNETNTNSDKKTNGTNSTVDFQKDYFLGSREETPAEKFIISLRLTKFTSRLHDGTNLCKDPSENVTESSLFPTLNMIKKIDSLTTNPLEWNSNQTFLFLKHFSPIKGIAKRFYSEEVDGEALMNLTTADLIKHFYLDQNKAEKLVSVFSQLRKEVIERYINI